MTAVLHSAPMLRQASRETGTEIRNPTRAGLFAR